MSNYAQRGVSAQKEEVHQAIKNLSTGLYPYAFCKLYPDYLGKDENFVNISHADGAGTKSILAYLYYKETGDVTIFEGIAKDAIVMNLDDLLCVGIYDNIVFSSTIDRNKNLVGGEVLEALINGSNNYFNTLKNFGINVHYLGGETADVGDIVRTIAVNGTMTARWEKNKLITNEKIDTNQVIVGLSSCGQASYETEYNSGLASNGLTSARHDVLSNYYAQNFKETFEPTLNNEVVYIGKNRLTDSIEIEGKQTTIGKLLLSPTRTYAPILKQILEYCFDDIFGLIHCSGGGQTKCLKYLPKNLQIVKDNLFDVPPIFKLIQKNSGADFKEMYQVFNMGHRMEIFTNSETAAQIIAIAQNFKVEAKVIGYTKVSNKKSLLLKGEFGEIEF